MPLEGNRCLQVQLQQKDISHWSAFYTGQRPSHAGRGRTLAWKCCCNVVTYNMEINQVQIIPRSYIQVELPSDSFSNLICFSSTNDVPFVVLTVVTEVSSLE